MFAENLLSSVSTLKLFQSVIQPHSAADYNVPLSIVRESPINLDAVFMGQILTRLASTRGWCISVMLIYDLLFCSFLFSYTNIWWV